MFKRVDSPTDSKPSCHDRARARWELRRSTSWLVRAICLLSLLVPGPAALRGQEERDLGAVLEADRIRVVGFGDFGYDGNDGGQSATATVMAAFDALLPYSLGLTVGDNFYPRGVSGVADAKFTKHWVPFYPPLGIRFYATLGNHDYKGNEDAEVAFTTSDRNVGYAWQMRFKSYTFAAGPVRFFALDTDEGTLPWCCRKRRWSTAQRDWLDRQLERHRTAKWKVVYGHHPIESDGDHHGDWSLRRLEQDLLPVLLKHKVTLYLAGHDHNLEYRPLADPGGHIVHHVIAGGGGKDLRGRKKNVKEAPHFFETFGFVELTATGDDFKIRLVDAATCRPVRAEDCELFSTVVR